MTEPAQVLHTTPDCEIVTRRVINAPREKVFAAWSQSQHLKNWWGPKGFTNTFQEFNFTEGGKWVFVMHGPEGGNYNNEVVFIKINQPEFIAWNRISKPLFQVQAIFKELPDDKTDLTFKMVFDSADASNKLRSFVVDKNEENFDRLEKELQNIL